MRYKILFFLVIIFVHAASGSVISYDELRKKPKSIVKDYYIYRLLTENNSITAIEASLLYGEVSNMNANLKNTFAKKINLSDTQEERECREAALKESEFIDEECVKLLVYPPFVASLDNKTKAKLTKKLLKSNHTFTAGWIGAMSEKDVFKALVKKGAKEFLLVFNTMPYSYKKAYLDKELSKSFIEKLEKEKGYGKLIKTVVLSSLSLDKLPKSLLYSSQNVSLSYGDFFLLGINALKFKRNDLAENFFQKAEQQAYYRSDKDKALFWQHLSNPNNETLKTLSLSYDINIYSLYAKEELNVSVENITFLKASTDKSEIAFNIQDPFEWRELLNTIREASAEELEKLAKKFDANDTLPIYAFILERASNYRHGYFIEPYAQYLEDIDDKRKALILSLAKKESNFIPSVVSTSYALGIMQFMPFLARDTAKKLKLENFDIDDMFNPQIAYKFANIHLDYLSSYLYHPLFIAYAYNGGIGFTRKMLQSGSFFNEGDYEPFLSIETIDYEESREYAKSVLANFIIYSRHFGQNVSVKTLLESLTKPSETDKFRQ